MDPLALVAMARSYAGTPFHHQGRLPGVGLDCAGLVLCSLSAIGETVVDTLPYARIPRNRAFIKCIEAQCDEVPRAKIQIGDFLTFAWKSEPQHISIVTQLEPCMMMIHAYQPSDKVIETNVDEFWMTKLGQCFRFVGVK